MATLTSTNLMSDLSIWCDGGALNNQNADIRQAYGSFAAVRDGQKVETTFGGVKTWQHSFTYGNETNNAAELMTAIHALMYLTDLQERGWKLGFRLCLDSQLVLTALKGVKKPAAQLQPYYDEITRLKAPIVWQLQPVKVDESQMKALLGH